MLYVLFDKDDMENFDVFEGVSGLNIDKIVNDFYANFDYRTLGEARLKYPKYYGPMKKLIYGPCSSGCIPEGSLVMDDNSKEYKLWLTEVVEIDKLWNEKRRSEIKKFQDKYGGKDLKETLIFYLNKEYGLEKKDVAFYRG